MSEGGQSRLIKVYLIWRLAGERGILADKANRGLVFPKGSVERGGQNRAQSFLGVELSCGTVSHLSSEPSEARMSMWAFRSRPVLALKARSPDLHYVQVVACGLVKRLSCVSCGFHVLRHGSCSCACKGVNQGSDVEIGTRHIISHCYRYMMQGHGQN